MTAWIIGVAVYLTGFVVMAALYSWFETDKDAVDATLIATLWPLLVGLLVVVWPPFLLATTTMNLVSRLKRGNKS